MSNDYQVGITVIMPVYKVENGRVEVVIGEVIHPMTEEHLIEWVSLQTKQ